MGALIWKTDTGTLTLNGRVITTFISGDFIELNPLNPHTARNYGSNKSVNVKRRADGKVYEIKLSVLKGQVDDIWLNEQINKADIVLFNGSYKEIFIRDGREGVNSYNIEAGTITDMSSTKGNNQDGSETMEYTIEAFVERNI